MRKRKCDVGYVVTVPTKKNIRKRDIIVKFQPQLLLYKKIIYVSIEGLTQSLWESNEFSENKGIYIFSFN